MTMSSVVGTQSRVESSVHHSGDFESLLPSVLDIAYRVAYSLLGNRAAAEGLVSNAALRASRERDASRPGMNFKTWFLGVVTEEFYSVAASASISIDWRDDEPIYQALDSLPVWERVVNALQMVGELRYQDIATVLDLPVSTVRARLHSGRARMRKELAWQ